MKRYIYLLRHGETEYGKEKRYLGHTNCELSKEGLKQAEHLANVFGKKDILMDSIFSSDLIRCKRTITIAFPNREVTFLEQLREINMGVWDGLTFEKVKSRYPDDFKIRGENISEFAPLNGESFKECQKRASVALKYIVNNSKGNIVICSHAGFIRALFCSLLNMDLKNIFDIKQSYGCINVVTIENLNYCVEGINLKSLEMN